MIDEENDIASGSVEPVEEGSADTSCDDACGQCTEYLHGWKRALADYDNLKKERSSERVAMRQFITDDVGERLIPVIDNFDQALRFKPEGLDASVEGWLQGILYVRTQLENVLKELGVEPFGVVGETFDPHRHDAVSEQESSGSPESVVEVVQRGWKRDQRILRPAKVVVSK